MRTIACPRAVNPLNFGRRRAVAAAQVTSAGLNDDVRLFLWTFAAGFVSVSLFLA